MTRKPIPPGRQPTYRSKLFPEHVHDAYKSSTKLPTPTVCPECGAVFADGRWQWLPRPDSAHREMCPACHRVHDRFPAGYVKLDGEFLREHRGELTELARNLERKEKAEHALQRIIDIKDENGGLLITTTDIHLAHGIGEALHHAYKGELESHYNREEKLLRVRWSR
jgi:NMD protein affecting ribosome stability and mRNA decay